MTACDCAQDMPCLGCNKLLHTIECDSEPVWLELMLWGPHTDSDGSRYSGEGFAFCSFRCLQAALERSPALTISAANLFSTLAKGGSA